jgi:hypothetical protein
MPTSGLQGIGPASDDDTRSHRRHAVDDGACALGGADGLSAKRAEDSGEREVDPFVTSTRPPLGARANRAALRSACGALVSFSSPSDAALDALLQVSAAHEAANIGRSNPRSSVPLITVPIICPTRYTSSRACHFGAAPPRMSLGVVNAFIVRAVIPRRSLCGRTMPKSPSFRRRPSQTKTFTGVRLRCSNCPRWSFPSISRVPAISRRRTASFRAFPPAATNCLLNRSPYRAYDGKRRIEVRHSL